jgi:hypothetical protein
MMKAAVIFLGMIKGLDLPFNLQEIHR